MVVQRARAAQQTSATMPPTNKHRQCMLPMPMLLLLLTRDPAGPRPRLVAVGRLDEKNDNYIKAVGTARTPLLCVAE